MQKKTVTVQNINGIHCRPSSAIVRAAMPFKSELRAECASGNANLKSMIEIITLALTQGADVTIITEGEDEVAALEMMCEKFTEIYDYPDKQNN